jgi:hypothetical protein
VRLIPTTTLIAKHFPSTIDHHHSRVAAFCCTVLRSTLGNWKAVEENRILSEENRILGEGNLNIREGFHNILERLSSDPS